LALEKGQSGTILHGAAEHVNLKEMAELIGEKLNVPVKSVPQEKAMEHFGFPGLLAGFQQNISNEITKKQTGWEPKQPGLLADMNNYYF
jgi:hypothetical protein